MVLSGKIELFGDQSIGGLFLSEWPWQQSQRLWGYKCFTFRPTWYAKDFLIGPYNNGFAVAWSGGWPIEETLTTKALNWHSSTGGELVWNSEALNLLKR